MWQQRFEQYKNDGFTVVGIALEAEGIEPARIYYEKHGVRFPSLVDPNYATRFQGVPKRFFVNELGVVQPFENWESHLKEPRSPVTESVREQWSDPQSRLNARRIARLMDAHRSDPADLAVAVDLGSRLIDRGRFEQARRVLDASTAGRRPKAVARSGDDATRRLLGQAYFQLSRATSGDRAKQVEFATLAFYLDPSVGLGKQIARIMAPEKFDGRPGGDFDNAFREGTLARLRQQRREWLDVPREKVR